jgi:hypothetical protein
VCSVPITLTTNPGAGGAKSYAQRLQAKGMKKNSEKWLELTCIGWVRVNMHMLGESFVEKVSDVRRRATVDGQAAAPGESLEFLAHIRGWHSEARKQRRDKLLQLDSDIGLRVALTGAAGADIFSIPEIHFAGMRGSWNTRLCGKTAASKIFTYQGSTTCMEVDKSWTIMSSVYSHLRQGGGEEHQ